MKHRHIAILLLALCAGSVAAAPVDGEKIYKATCLSCHGAGVLGAPKTGDKAGWKPRIAKGKPALYASALNGVKMMPPRGGNPALKDDEIKAVVDYMIAKSN